MIDSSNDSRWAMPQHFGSGVRAAIPPRARARLFVTSSLGIVAVAGLGAAPARAQLAPPNLVSVCSGVSLPDSVVTAILAPVVNGLGAPLQDVLNQPLVGLLGVTIDPVGILADAAAGAPATLQVLNTSGTVVGPTDQCDAQADSLVLTNPAGIALGGNRVTGLGGGPEALAGEINSIALGNAASTDAAAGGSIALGTAANVGPGGLNSVAIGTGAQATAAGSVALGTGSIAAIGPRNGSAGEVSVGAPGAERQITNVAAGIAPTDAVNVAQFNALADGAVRYDGPERDRVTLGGAATATAPVALGNVAAGTVAAGSTDAVNGGQLFALGQNAANAVTYDVDAAGTRTNRVTLSGGDAAAPVTLGNVAAGAVAAGSTDAVNGGQLNDTNAAVANLVTNVAGNTTAITSLTTDVANGAVGPVRYSSPAAPTVPNGGIPSNDLTLVGAAAGPVGLHNVAAGAIAAGSTDAVNGGQVFALGQNAVNAVTYDVDAAGVRTNRVTLSGGDAAAPVTVGNVAAGTVAAGSAEAVNGGQLFSTNRQVAGDTAALGGGAGFDAATNIYTAPSYTVRGTVSTNVGSAIAALDTAVGQALVANGNALQYDNAGRTAATLNPGGAPTVLRNVGAGVLAGDAVNLGQLQSASAATLAQANGYTDSRINTLDFTLRRRIDATGAKAAALSGVPQSIEPGKGFIGAAVGGQGAQVAFALGLSKVFDGEHLPVVKAAVSVDTRGYNATYNIGAGLHF